MTFWGAGPLFTILSLTYCGVVIGIGFVTGSVVKIPLLSDKTAMVSGIVIITAGLPFYLTALIGVKRAYASERLVTTGPFGMCRHPVYAAWVIFFVPGIMLIINTWLGLTAPIVMYFLIISLVKKEEAYLEAMFGKDYLDYKQRTPAVLPVGWIMNRRDRVQA